MFHVKQFVEDTIVAQATPPGSSGVGVIRVSGKNAIACLKKLFILSSPLNQFDARKIYHGWIQGAEGKIDNVLAWVAYGPHSYTGEDTAEISCHGGALILGFIIEEMIRGGARLAAPGEFAKRAFLNGKIDLMQAEAIIDVISAKTKRALQAANAQLEGALSKRVAEIREKLVGLLAAIEARMDFPGEVDGEIDLSQLARAESAIEALLKTADQGQILRRGARVVILGKPNVGKSSLLNALLENERAIVTDTPGTTRDTIEEMASINGVPVIYIDTAGLREAGDRAEALGIERTKREIDSADIIINLLDGTENEMTEEEIKTANQLKNKNIILVINKTDLPVNINLKNCYRLSDAIQISALKKYGVEKIKAEIFSRLLISDEDVENGFINERQKVALEKAKECLGRMTAASGKGVPQDLLSIDLRTAIVLLGELSGEDISEEVINTIFSRFCVGK